MPRGDKPTTPALALKDGWVYEDTLPPTMTQEQYDWWYKESLVLDGVRMGPPPPGETEQAVTLPDRIFAFRRAGGGNSWHYQRLEESDVEYVRASVVAVEDIDARLDRAYIAGAKFGRNAGEADYQQAIRGRYADIQDAAAVSSPLPVAPRCSGCGNEIDPKTCWCGQSIDHGYDNHMVIPMGCDCYRDDAAPAEPVPNIEQGDARTFEAKLLGFGEGDRIKLCEPCLRQAISDHLVSFSSALPAPVTAPVSTGRQRFDWATWQAQAEKFCNAEGYARPPAPTPSEWDILALLQSCAATSTTPDGERERGYWPTLLDRGDGVREHYCVGRLIKPGEPYWEFWNKGEWVSAGEVFIGREAAEAQLLAVRNGTGYADPLDSDAVDNELRRWQDAIRDKLIQLEELRAATPSPGEPPPFRTTKEAMEWAQSNHVPAVIPVTADRCEHGVSLDHDCLHCENQQDEINVARTSVEGASE